MDLGLKDKLVLVTGSGSGIGKATAKTYMKEGARLIVHGLTEEEVISCVDDLSSLGDVKGFAGDLAKTDEAIGLADFAKSHGNLDILINNVGIFSVKPFD